MKMVRYNIFNKNSKFLVKTYYTYVTTKIYNILQKELVKTNSEVHNLVSNSPFKLSTHSNL